MVRVHFLGSKMTRNTYANSRNTCKIVSTVNCHANGSTKFAHNGATKFAG